MCEFESRSGHQIRPARQGLSCFGHPDSDRVARLASEGPDFRVRGNLKSQVIDRLLRILRIPRIVLIGKATVT